MGEERPNSSQAADSNVYNNDSVRPTNVGDPRSVESCPRLGFPAPPERAPRAPRRRGAQAHFSRCQQGLSGLLRPPLPTTLPRLWCRLQTPSARRVGPPSGHATTPARSPAYRPVLVVLWSAGAYFGQLRTAIQRFKYRGRTDLARPLARLLADTWVAGRGAADVVVPVPQHPARTRQRGSTPATLLARALATQVGLPCADKALARVRDTPPQVGLSARARWVNVQGAFGPGPDSTALRGADGTAR